MYVYSCLCMYVCVCIPTHTHVGFPCGSVGKNPPTMQETWLQSVGWEDPLEKEMATHTCILVWRIPWTEKPGGLQSIGLQRVGHD